MSYVGYAGMGDHQIPLCALEALDTTWVVPILGWTARHRAIKSPIIDRKRLSDPTKQRHDLSQVFMRIGLTSDSGKNFEVSRLQAHSTLGDCRDNRKRPIQALNSILSKRSGRICATSWFCNR
jgi:hypothetical protein